MKRGMRDTNTYNYAVIYDTKQHVTAISMDFVHHTYVYIFTTVGIPVKKFICSLYYFMTSHNTINSGTDYQSIMILYTEML